MTFKCFDQALSMLEIRDKGFCRPAAVVIAICQRVSAEGLRKMQYMNFHVFDQELPINGISQILTWYGNEFIQYPLNVRDYRQFADSMFDRALRARYKPIEVLRKNMALLGGHSAGTRDEWYGNEVGGEMRETDISTMAQLCREFNAVRGPPSGSVRNA